VSDGKHDRHNERRRAGGGKCTSRGADDNDKEEEEAATQPLIPPLILLIPAVSKMGWHVGFTLPRLNLFNPPTLGGVSLPWQTCHPILVRLSPPTTQGGFFCMAYILYAALSHLIYPLIEGVHPSCDVDNVSLPHHY
jgi:hypothetical protein